MLIYQTDENKLNDHRNILILIRGWLWYSNYLIKSTQRDQLVDFLEKLNLFSSNESNELKLVLNLVKNSIIVF